MQSSIVLARQLSLSYPKNMKSGISSRRIVPNAKRFRIQRSFLEGSRVVLRPQAQRIYRNCKSSFPFALLLTSSQIASTAFAWGTVFVVPFHTLMILAPKASLTKRVMESNIPYAALGLMYGFLLHLSWTPATLHTIFATKHLLPELPGMTKMFSNEMTMASAWIHFLAVDLYAARQVYHDGLENNVETRHSVTLCLFFCPIGILSHVITKMFSKASSISKEAPIPPINEIGK